MVYRANFIEDAVTRVDETNNIAYAKLLTKLDEFEVAVDSDIVLGNPEYLNTPYFITKTQYDSFGKSWKFGTNEGETITI